jgi:hypothetical protein
VNHCGGCTACCVTLAIDEPELKKPAAIACPHCVIGSGCQIYRDRPQACRTFKCNWLKSQDTPQPMAAELRPDRCGAIFTDDTIAGDPKIFEVHGEPNAAAWDFINARQAAGYKAKQVTQYLTPTALVAGVIDAQGGVRTVVGTWAEIVDASKGEHFYLVPGLRVSDPVPREQIPAMIARVHQHVAKVAWHRLSSRTQAVLRGQFPAISSSPGTRLS